MKLSELIINYRKRMNISQREFSRKCDLSNTYISFLENENNPKTGKPIIPTLEQYKKLAGGMGITVQELFELLDRDAPVDIGPSNPLPVDTDIPKNDDIRLLIRGLNKLSPDQLQQAKNVMKAMFVQYADYFDNNEEEENDQ